MNDNQTLEQLKANAITALKAYYSEKYLHEMEREMPGLSEQDAKMAVYLADSNIQYCLRDMLPIKKATNDFMNGLKSFTMQERAEP